MQSGELLDHAESCIKRSTRYELRGVVTDVRGIIVEGNGPMLAIGSNVVLESKANQIGAQVVGFNKDRILLMPYGDVNGILPGTPIKAYKETSEVFVSDQYLGRVMNGLEEPLDGKPMPLKGQMVPLMRQPPDSLRRKRISEPFDLGVRSMNAMLTVGVGQRVAIMSGSGVGKSTLLGMIAKHSNSDVNVIGLVGERGREVREFIERDLGEEGLKRSIVIVATSDQSPLVRIRAAFMATAVAEYFRDQGKNVVLMIDSLTRFAMAQREIGLAVGEPPSTKGYTPSVFSLLPKLLERAGTTENSGSITGIYTVLVEADDMNEPIADSVRGIVDGHIVLSRRLAGKGHFPAIEMLESVSRVMSDIVDRKVVDVAAQARDVLATYRENEDLLTIGAYKEGLNKRVDRAVKLIDKLNEFLRQRSSEKVTLAESWQQLSQIFESVN